MADTTALLSAQASLSAAGDGSTTRSYNESYAASLVKSEAHTAIPGGLSMPEGKERDR